MPKYRKTALVEAEQFLPGEGRIPAGVYSSERADPRKNPLADWMLDTLEGPHILRGGDYICTGPGGEKWNVAREIFEATYELAKTEPPAAEGEVTHKPWYEIDAHRDLSRIIPDMEGKIAEAEVKFAHCLPAHLFSPLKASITELRVLRHELASRTTETEAATALREAVDELRHLYRAYVSTLEAGRDRILTLGGDCDLVEQMEEGDPALIRARAALAALTREKANG